MSSQEYIHINEAVKAHGKTRQTFYNYIHKGLVRTKKVNNKVYLNTSDVEQLMNGYIPDAIEPTQVTKTSQAEEHPYGDIIDAKDIPTSPPKTDQPATDQRSILKDLARLHQQYYDLKDSVIQQIHSSKQDLLFEHKIAAQNTEYKISNDITQKIKGINQSITPLTSHIQRIHLSSKKSLFRAGYASFILLNLLITTYVL